MKLQTSNNKIERIGKITEKSFSFATNSISFKAVTESLYTDVPLAIVRELSTNAHDAQVDSQNTDKPFDVQLPNPLAPTFRIRDYGPGISPKNIDEVYRKIFESSRRKSNDHVGCWGLGSKTPFAYADNFTITSINGGYRYEYAAFHNEDETPTIALMNGEETNGKIVVPSTNEPSGLEISIPIQSQDTYKFTDAAKKVYQYFKVRPNIVGGQIEFDKHEAMIESDGYQLFEKYIGSSQIHVVMGQVCYAVRSDKLTKKLGYYSGIVLYMNVGDCSVTLSREELHYDDKTIETLQKALDKAHVDVEKQILADIDQSMNAIEKAIAIDKYTNIFTLHLDSRRIYTDVIDIYSLENICVQTTYTGKSRLLFNTTSYFIPASGNVYTFIENDVDQLTQKWKNRLRHWIEQNGTNYQNKYYIINITDRAKVEEMFGTIATKISELPAAPRATSVSRDVTRQYMRKFRPDHRLVYSWTAFDEVNAENACCIPKKGYRPIWQGKEVRPNDLRGVGELLGFDNVYGISKPQYAKLSKAHDLPDLEKAAKEYIEKYVKNATKAEIYNLIRNQSYCYNDFNSEFLEAIKGLSDECDNLESTQVKIEHREAILKLMQYFDLTPDVANMPNFKEIFYAKYPLIEQISYFSEENIEHATQYIKLIEGK